jgi:hypothetical protein
MPAFAQGQRVVVTLGSPCGLGTVHDVFGGPDGAQYRVLMDQRGEDGQRAMAITRDFQMEASAPIAPYAVGQRVTYLARGATVTDVEPSGDPDDPRDDVLYVLCDRDPPELWTGIEHAYIFILPAWKLHAYPR